MPENDRIAEPRFDVFLSSCFADYDPADRDHATKIELGTIREDTRLSLEQEGISAWTWENWEKTAEAARLNQEYPGAKIPVFREIAVFRRALMQSHIVILFVSHRRGSQVRLPGDGIETYGTFLEIEVFFAIALGKPIILFREEGGEVEEPLEQLLSVAVKSKGIYHEEVLKKADLPKRSVAAYAEVKRKLEAAQGRFTSLLARRRDPALDYRKMTRFLYGVGLPPLTGHPNLDVVDRLLKAEQEPDVLLSERLSRLWLAIQELLPHRDKLAQEPPFLERWLTCLDRWSAAASWFGLHAHLGVSPLVTHGDRARLIEDMSVKTPIPYGPMASARYSIARREAVGVRRYFEMRKVIKDSRRAIDAGDWDNAGAYAIMGHAFIYNIRLWSAVDAFERGLALRKQEKNEARIGEGECDLGFAMFLTGRVRSGIRRMEDGISLLENSDALGFYLKSMKKLELAYKVTRQRDKANKLRRRRTERATADEFFDQAE
jgi:hypothetical protein